MARRAEAAARRRAEDEARRRVGAAKPPEERIQSRLLFWVQGQRLKGGADRGGTGRHAGRVAR